MSVRIDASTDSPASATCTSDSQSLTERKEDAARRWATRESGLDRSESCAKRNESVQRWTSEMGKGRAHLDDLAHLVVLERFGNDNLVVSLRCIALRNDESRLRLCLRGEETLMCRGGESAEPGSAKVEAGWWRKFRRSRLIPRPNGERGCGFNVRVERSADVLGEQRPKPAQFIPPLLPPPSLSSLFLDVAPKLVPPLHDRLPRDFLRNIKQHHPPRQVLHFLPVVPLCGFLLLHLLWRERLCFARRRTAGEVYCEGVERRGEGLERRGEVREEVPLRFPPQVLVVRGIRVLKNLSPQPRQQTRRHLLGLDLSARLLSCQRWSTEALPPLFNLVFESGGLEGIGEGDDFEEDGERRGDGLLNCWVGG